MVRFSDDAVLKTVVFRKSLQVWRRKPVAQKTWINFQAFMVTQYKYYLEDQEAEDSQPFSGSAVHKETLSALQNVVEAMTNNRTDISVLAEANAATVATKATLEIHLKMVLKQIAVLTT